MSDSRGICTNFGGCAKADQKETIDIPPGAEFKCPECNLLLSPVAGRGMSRTTRTRLLAAGTLIAVGLAGTAVARMLSSARQDRAEDKLAVAPFTDSLASDSAGRIRSSVSTHADSVKDSPEPRFVTARKAPIVKRPTIDASAPAPPAASVQVRPLTAAPQPAAQALVQQAAQVPTQQPAPPVVDTPRPPAPASPVIPRRASIEVHLSSQICEEASHVGDAVQMQLSSALTLSDGSAIPVGANVTGSISGKKLNGNQPPLIELEANGIDFNGKSVAIETNPFSFYMQRPSIAGSIVKGTIIGAAAGAAVGVILKKDVGRTAGIGAVVGAGVGAATGHPQACVSSKDTKVVFVLAKEATLP